MKLPFPTVGETRLLIGIHIAVLLGLVLLFPGESVGALLRLPAEFLEAIEGLIR
jgi:hypothetical protein